MGANDNAALLLGPEMGCGLGHLLGLLQDDYRCVGIDLIDYSIEQTKLNAPKAEAYQMNAKPKPGVREKADDMVRFEMESASAGYKLVTSGSVIPPDARGSSPKPVRTH